MLVCPACNSANDDGAEMCFTCGRGLSGLTHGSLVGGRYEILKPLGKGGMGIVYKAHDRHLDEIVALKVLRADIERSPDLAKRFRSEIKLARRVRHPNVCGIHEYGQDGHLQYISMEFIEGTDLRQEMRTRGAFPPEEAYRVSIQVADGLQAVHDVGIIHRDLKTPNIMRDAHAGIRLMDFGIAKSQGAGTTSGVTSTGQVVGTPEYMSPEQCQGQPIDHRSDIYALGIVIFELFTGDVPFRGDTPLAVLFKHLQEPPPLEGGPAARIPPALAPVLRKTLAKRPEQRYSSARELAAALRAASSRLALPRSEAASATAVTLGATALRLETPAAIDRPTPIPASIPTPIPGLPDTPVAPVAAARTSPERIPEPRSGRRQMAPRHPAPRSGLFSTGAMTAGLLCAGGVVLAIAFMLTRARPPMATVVPSSTVEVPESTGRPTGPDLDVPPATTPPPAVAAPPPLLSAPALLQPAAAARLALSEADQVPVRFAWNPVAGAQTYRFTLTTAVDDARSYIERPSLTATSIELYGLAAGTYWWRVTPIDGMGRAGTVSSPWRFDVVRMPVPRRSTAPQAVEVSPGSRAALAGRSTAGEASAPTVPRGLTESGESAGAQRQAGATGHEPGRLQVGARPWAEISVDDKAAGTAPTVLTLPAGTYTIRFAHPDYQPILRKVTVQPGEAAKLSVDFSVVGVPK